MKLQEKEMDLVIQDIPSHEIKIGKLIGSSTFRVIICKELMTGICRAIKHHSRINFI
jgi:hypothetical protein